MKEKVSFILEDFLCLCAEVLLFLPENRQKKNGGNYMPKEFYLYVKGQKVKVSEQIYKVYWQKIEYEKYLERVDRKNHLLLFSQLDHDGHFVDNLIDESTDVEKIVETQILIEAVRKAISQLNSEERDIIERLYLNDETVRSVAKLKSITHPALIKRRNKILEKLKKFIEEL